MATSTRYIKCVLCLPEQDWHIPATWSSDYAMTWYHTVHIATTHIDDVLRGPTALLGRATPFCRPCRAANAIDRTAHRPCFEADCYCACSRPTTTVTEETARAE